MAGCKYEKLSVLVVEFKGLRETVSTVWQVLALTTLMKSVVGWSPY